MIYTRPNHIINTNHIIHLNTNVFLWQDLQNSIGHWVRSIECIEDSVKN